MACAGIAVSGSDPRPVLVSKCLDRVAWLSLCDCDLPILVNPFMEEYFWRGYLGSPTNRLHVSDFLYAGFHAFILMGKTQASSIINALILLVLAGWFWRQIAREDHGLLASVLGHMTADLTILVAVYRMSRIV